MESIAIAADQSLDGRLAQIRARDSRAFRELVELLDGDLLRLCILIAADSELARDAVQETWTRLWTRPPKLRNPARLRSWLLSVAANEVRQSMRRARLAGAHAPIEPPASPQATSAEVIDLRNALARLNHSDRELLALKYLFGMDSPEISIHLGASAANVRTRLHRIITRLRKELRDDE